MSAVVVDSALDPFLAERRHMSPGLALAHRFAGGGAWETHASGAWITVSDGRRLLDLGSYGVNLLGHRHPTVVSAVATQLDRLPATSRSLANDVTPALATRLVEAVDSDALRRCWFGSTGADAVELALKLARAATGRPRVIAAVGAFHGKTLGALGATWHPRYRDPFSRHLEHTTHVDVSDVDGLERELALGDVAAVILEPIQGEGGVVPVQPATLRRWCDLSRSHGAHFIADEVQTGFGRCGPMSLAIDMGAEVSAVLLGKALGGGVAPISALIGTDQFFLPLVRDPFLHTSTFGGHPLCAAAALGALDALDALGDLDCGAASIERVVRQLPIDFADLVVEVRGRGFLWGIELRDPELAGRVLAELTSADVIVSPCLGRPDVIRLLPPATLTAEEVTTAAARLRGALRRVQRSLRLMKEDGGVAR